MNKRRKTFCLMAFISFGAISFFSMKVTAQQLPAFSMHLTNGKIFSNKNLSPGKPVIIIYFAPDCDHCLNLMDTLFKKIGNFKKAQVLLVTFKPLTEVAEFEKNYNTAKYPNIKLGIEDPVFFFRNYYHIDTTPYTAVFDKHKKLVISYKQETPVADLIKRLKVL